MLYLKEPVIRLLVYVADFQPAMLNLSSGHTWE